MNETITFLLNNLLKEKSLEPLICIQGGGAKGSWQGGVLEACLESDIIKPVRVWGTSAGAINSLLMSEKLHNPNKEPFKLFWVNSKKKFFLINIITLLCILILPTFLPILILSKVILYLIRKEKHYPGIIPFMVYQKMISMLLPTVSPVKIPLHMYATNINNSRLPRYNNQNLGTFKIHQGNVKAELMMGEHKKLIPLKTAISISCCLPSINPWKIGNKSFLDGGILSNLPLNVVPLQAIGNSIILILATPIKRLKLNEDIDYRTLQELRYVKEEQDKFKNNALKHRPVLVIQPQKLPESGRLYGFINLFKMERDYYSGLSLGRKFVDDISIFFSNGDRSKIESYLLLNIDFPELPQKRPGFSKCPWKFFLNHNWRA